MRYLLPSIAILVASCGDASLRQAEDALREGNKAYRADNFGGAIERYDEALHDPRVRHNAGKAAYRAGDLNASVERLVETTEVMEDPDTRSDAFHDLGNAAVMLSKWADSLATALTGQIATSSAAADDIAGRVKIAVVRDSLRREHDRAIDLADSSLVQGVAAFKQALRLDPADEDTRHNFFLAQQLLARKEKEKQERDKQKKDEQQELSEKARMLIAQADELVEAFRFKEAFELLQRGLQEDPTLAKEKEYIDKLEVVNKAAEAT